MSLLPMLVAQPLAVATLVFLLPARVRAATSLVMLAVLGAGSVALFARVVDAGPQAHALGGWSSPLGIGLRADGLSGGMLVLTAVVTAACAVHAQRYLRDRAGSENFWPLMWFLVAALNSIWLSADLFNQYVGLELLGLSAVGLVALAGTSEALGAAMRYLLMALLGSLAYLLGVGLVYAAVGSLSLSDLSASAGGHPTLLVAFALMQAGLVIKAALFPLHGWLPPAHAGALTPVSALLSALVVKASLYILIRLWMSVDPSIMPSFSAQGLGALGACAVFWGGVLALRQTSLKRLVAYSTVSQLGYLFLFFPLVSGTSSNAMRLAADGTWLMIVSHALAKAGMFLAAGNLAAVVRDGRIAELAGISRFRPLSVLSFGVAGVSLMGLPPSGGFTAKWLLIQSAIASDQWHWVAVLLAGGLLSAAYVFNVFRHVFVEDSTQPLFSSPPLAQEAPALALGCASIVLGLAAAAPLDWMRVGLTFERPW